MIWVYLSNLGMGGGSSAALTFRETLAAKLAGIPELGTIVGTAIFPGQLPQSWDLGADGPAVTFAIPSYPRGNALASADGTATARVQIDAWGYSLSDVDAAILAIWNDLDGPPNNPWASGGVKIMSCSHSDEHDQHEAPQAGSDQWIYHIVSEYSIRHWTGIPTLS